MQVVVEEDDLEFTITQCMEGFLRTLGEYRFGQALPKPQDSIFGVLYNENRPFHRYVKLLGHR
jgi:hypothetical protein